jgi:predicted AlkP superfamily phosphohydrolase/phosphomutase
MEKHERVARHLAGSRPADLFFSVVQALDHLQHLFWDEVAGDSDREAYVALAERCYRLADEAIGHRAALAGDEATLFLVSDHGFGPARKWFHVNRFLQELGLLVLGAGGEGAAGTTATRLGLTPEKMRGLVRRLDVLGLRRWVGRLARVSLGRRLDERLTPPVDWGRTRAISGSPATEGIFINRDLVADPGDYEALRRRLAAELLALRDPEGGEAVVEAVYRREEIYDGPFLDQLPDLVFDLGRRPYLAGDSLTAEQVLAPLPRDYLQGRHRPLGIFAAAGPNIRPAGRLEGPLKEGPLKEGPLLEGPLLEGPRIVDVAPTVLYALDLPIPEDVDGRPLLEIFDDDYRAAHPVRHAPPVRPGESGGPAGDGPAYDDDDLDEMQRRLQGLGYVS